MVFDNLIFNYAHTAFFHGHFSQRNTFFVGSQGCCAEDIVHLFLGVGVNFLSGANLLDYRIEFFAFQLFRSLYNLNFFFFFSHNNVSLVALKIF